MPTTHTLVIGAGQAGLAVSRSLADADVDHVVLERGRVAERWRSHRWESLRLLTPNWATRLPGWSYQGPDPDGYMTATELAAYLDRLRRLLRRAGRTSTARSAPSSRPTDGYAVRTDDAHWRAANVVIATGWCDEPRVPAVAAALDPTIAQVTTSSYRNPDELPDGRRPGRRRLGHRRAARRRARPRRSRRRAGRRPPQPAPPLLPGRRHLVVARPDRHVRPDHRPGLRPGTVPAARAPCSWPADADRRDVDLPALQRLGVRLAGRLVGVDGARVGFADDLPVTTAAADARLERILAPDRRPHPCPRARRRGAPGRAPRRPVDLAERARPAGPARRAASAPSSGPPGSPGPTRGCTSPCSTSGARSPIAAASPPTPGLYVLGQRFQHRRDSNFIDGVRHDAAHVARHIASRLQSHEPIAS